LTSNHFFIEKTRVAGKSATLEGLEHRHLSKAARCRVGDVVWLFDEEGTKYRARVEGLDPVRTTLAILEKTNSEETRTRIMIGQSLLKAKAMDFIVQKATELGAFAFIPILSSRSIAKIGEQAEKKVARWAKIAREAAKQAKTGMVPRIEPVEALAEILGSKVASKKIFLSERSGRYLRDLVSGPSAGPPPDAIILVGPEGGWTEEEEAAIIRSGFEAASLGKSVLRAETASLSALAILTHFWNW
jgi:16S rRNA (uracil1498-N3)-methyltransferase